MIDYIRFILDPKIEPDLMEEEPREKPCQQPLAALMTCSPLKLPGQDPWRGFRSRHHKGWPSWLKYNQVFCLDMGYPLREKLLGMKSAIEEDLQNIISVAPSVLCGLGGLQSFRS